MMKMGNASDETHAMRRLCIVGRWEDFVCDRVLHGIHLVYRLDGARILPSVICCVAILSRSLETAHHLTHRLLAAAFGGTGQCSMCFCRQAL
jgi:hypothetical protein